RRMTSAAPAGPLAGVLVLDLSRVLAGPYCTMILGDLGAEVIKVEHPRGDETRAWGPPFRQGESAYYLSVNRNKRSLVADLDRAEDRALIRRIAQRADVVVENFLPGALERRGLELDSLRAENPRLITLTISGMGATGPERSTPGYDFIVQAAGGLMSITGPADGPPSKAGVAVVDLTTGMMAANAVLAALFARERSGRGQHIDISLLETQVAWLANVGTGYLVSGEPPQRQGNAHPTIVPYQTFRTRDGVLAVGVGNDAQWERFCAALGHAALARDERFRTNPDRVRQRAALVSILEEIFLQRGTAQWVADIRAAQVPVSAVRSVPEVLNDPQVIERGMVAAVAHPTIGELKLLGVPFKFSDTPALIRRHPPLLGEHTTEIEREFGGPE
ncbi:MAG TPA: CoA transferase, partial [Longimicrobiales bacterium]|nr:CoA transferase [Longimicrobiales bacterium]